MQRLQQQVCTVLQSTIKAANGFSSGSLLHSRGLATLFSGRSSTTAASDVNVLQERSCSSLGTSTSAPLLPCQHLPQQFQQPTASRMSSFQQFRGILGAPAKAHNPQIHTHDKYKIVNPQPTYDWMIGRFVMDRNGVVWHKQSNSSSKRSKKTPGALGRLARLKPLHNTFAAKFRKLGLANKLKYWAAPDAKQVPGFEGAAPYKYEPRRNARPNNKPYGGDPALLPHKKNVLPLGAPF